MLKWLYWVVQVLNNPLQLAAAYETNQAVETLREIAGGRTIAPSVAAETAQVLQRYHRTAIEALAVSDESLDELISTLKDPSEYLFGWCFADE